MLNKTLSLLYIAAAALLGWILVAAETASGHSTTPAGPQDEFQHWSLAFNEPYASHGIVTGAGDFMLVGRNPEPGPIRAWIARLAPNGSVIWERDYEANGDDTYPNSIHETSDLGFIVGGKTAFNPWIMKISGDGSVDWQKEYSILGEIQMAIEITAGGYLAVGQKENDFWIVKLDPDGDLVWQQSFSRFGGSTFESARSVVEAGDGSFIVAGYGGSPNSSWVLKLDSAGDVVWQKQISAAPATLHANQIISTSDGNFVIVGETHDGVPANWNAWIAKLDTDANVLWQKTADITPFDTASSITEMPNGDLVIGGSAQIAEDEYRGLMARLEADGDWVWGKIHPLGTSSQFYSVASVPGGDIFAVGTADALVNDLGGLLAVRTGGDGQIEDCALIQDAAGSVGSGTAALSETSVSPAVPSVSDSVPVLEIFEVTLRLEVFCSIYTEPAASDYWALNFGRYTDDDYGFYASAVDLASDGKYVVAGGFLPNGTGNDHAWAMKLGPDGEIVWQLSMGNGEDDDFNDVVLDPADNAYLAGYTDDGTDTNGLLAKVDPDGNVLWLKSYGGSGGESFGEIARLPTGDLLMLGGTTSSGMGQGDLWLVKVDSNGTLIWEYTFGGSSFEFSRSLALAENGDIFIAGLTQSFGAGGNDVWVLRLDSNANILWQRTFGGAATDHVETVLEAPNGDILIGGKTYNAGAGSGDAWILRLASDGTSIWQLVAGNTSEDAGYAMTFSTGGDLIVAGSVRPDPGPFPITYGWIINVSAAGSVNWEYRIGSLGTEALSDVAVDADGNLIAVGYSDSPGIDDESVTKALVVRLDPTGLVCNCLAEIPLSSTFGSTTVAGLPSTAVRQTPSSTTDTPTIASLTINAETNALCRLVPVEGPTPTPSPSPTASATATAGPPTNTPTPTPTGTIDPPTQTPTGSPAVDYLIFLPIVVRD